LRQAGHGEEAIRRLRTSWEERPTDEDALRLLLELLGERERFEEAEACYAKAEAALAEDGHDFSNLSLSFICFHPPFSGRGWNRALCDAS